HAIARGVVGRPHDVAANARRRRGLRYRLAAATHLVASGQRRWCWCSLRAAGASLTRSPRFADEQAPFAASACAAGASLTRSPSFADEQAPFAASACAEDASPGVMSADGALHPHVSGAMGKPSLTSAACVSSRLDSVVSFVGALSRSWS